MNYNGYSINIVREHNLKIITRLLYEKTLSCKELAEITDLSETAIKKNIAQLLDEGLVKVYSEEIKKKSVGRQHIRYQINEDYGAFACIDLSHEHDTILICDVCGNTLYLEKLNLKTFITKKDYNNICEIIKKQSKLLNVRIHEIAISIPGQIDPKSGIVNFSSRIQGEENERIQEHFATQFPNSLILIQNDIRFAIKGDELLNSRSQDTVALYIQIGYGIVSALVCNGKVIYGYKGIAGEIGTSVDENNISFHEKCSVSSLMLQAKEIATFDDLEGYMKEYAKNDEIKEQVKKSAQLLAHEIDTISNAVGANNIVLLGSITKYGSMYLNEVQTTLDNISKTFDREVCFLLGDDLIEKGMIKLLKERICYTVIK